jgi:hypothetical protein
MNSPDAIAEAALIALSQDQRAVMQRHGMRWCAVLANAGEHEQAERLRREIADHDQRKDAA